MGWLGALKVLTDTFVRGHVTHVYEKFAVKKRAEFLAKILEFKKNMNVEPIAKLG